MTDQYPRAYGMMLDLFKSTIAIKGITKTELAKKLGLNRSYFSQMVSGSRMMPYEVQKELLAELDIEEVWAKLYDAAAEDLNRQIRE